MIPGVSDNTTGTLEQKKTNHLAEYSHHVAGLSELEGIEFSKLTGKLSPDTFDNVSET